MDNSKQQPIHNTSTMDTRAGQRHRDPLVYTHPYDSMRQYAELLALRHDSVRTRHTTGGGAASGEPAQAQGAWSGSCRTVWTQICQQTGLTYFP